MRPVSVSVGPLAAASANNICQSQTPGAGTTLVLNGALASSMFVGTGSVAGNLLTITAATSGTLPIGATLCAVGMPANAKVIGKTGATTNGVGTYVLNVSGTVASTTVYGNPVVTLDTPRRVLLTPTGNESANTFTITGTMWSGDVVFEVLTGGNATATYSNLDFQTITQIVATNTAAGSLTFGTNGVASSQWVVFDDYAPAAVAVQVTASGTVNYTVQQTVQELAQGGSLGTLMPYQLTWLNIGDPNAVSQTASVQTGYTFAPHRARVTLNSGTGTLSAVFAQYGVAPY